MTLPWPRRGVTEVALKQGGHTLRGKVITSDGAAIANAKIAPGLYSGYRPNLTTDANGEFAIFGVPNDKTRLFPVVEADGFVTKDTFGVDLEPDGPTAVTWTLATATTVVGKVVDAATGKGVGGVKIAAGSDRFASNRKNPETTSNADGSFRLTGVPEGNVLVHAFSPRHAPEMKSAQTSTTAPQEINFEVSTGDSVTGTVKTADGTPLAGVWLVTDTWNGARMFERQTRSDAQGRFELVQMPKIAAQVDVLLKDYVSKRRVKMSAGEQLDLVLNPIVTHAYNIRAETTGELVPDLQIHKGYQWTRNVAVNWENRESDISRHFNAATGTFQVSNGEPIEAKIFYRFRAVGYEDVIVEVPDATVKSQTTDIVMKPLGVVEGFVVDAETGLPKSGVTVALTSKEDRLRGDHFVNYQSLQKSLKDFTGLKTITDDDGRFSLAKLAGTSDIALVLVDRQGCFCFIKDASLVLAQDNPRIPFPAGGSISGTLSVDGKPIAGEQIRIGWQGMGSKHDWDLPFGVGGQVTTDNAGQFEFAGLGPGRYMLQRVRSFESAGGSSSMSMYLTGETVKLLPGQTLVHNVTIPAGVRVLGTAVDLAGNRLANCIVNVQPAGSVIERIEAVRSDAEGRFVVEHLPPGVYDFEASEYPTTPSNQCGLGNEKRKGTVTAMVDGQTEIVVELEDVVNMRIYRL